MTKSKVRIYIQNSNIPFSTEMHFHLDDNQSSYLLNVMRMKIGSKLSLFNSQDGEWLSELISVVNHKVIVKLLELTRIPKIQHIDFGLFFGIVKRTALSTIVRQATELGISFLQPIYTEFTVNPKININKLQKIIIEAAEQCCRLDTPPIFEPIVFSELKNAVKNRYMILCDKEGYNTISIPLNIKKIGVLLGPEGGFSPKELAALNSLINFKMSLGTNTLRADTAGASAVSSVIRNLEY